MRIMNVGKFTETAGGIEIAADKSTDFFIDDRAGIRRDNAPFMYREIGGDFVISARVSPEFAATYDAGGLFVYQDAENWIKHEFEMTDLGYPSIVSVVTRGTSDDCNGEKMEGRTDVYLQVIRRGDYWALHHSADGINWKMARYFQFKMADTIKVGFEAQSPIGLGSKCEFRDISIGNKEVSDMRKGK